jgi:hypothetical protein
MNRLGSGLPCQQSDEWHEPMPDVLAAGERWRRIVRNGSDRTVG